MNLPLDPSSAAPAPAQRATRWQLRTRTLTIGHLPLWMGVVNVTPDSFSDGGRFLDPSAAIDHALRLASEGADILDIGGESTQPRSRPVDAREELRRVLPVVEAVCRQTLVPVSIDTSKALVAREVLAAGAEIVNDVTALTGDPAMESVVVESGCGVCLMHMQGTPATMQQQPQYTDVVAEVQAYLRARRDALLGKGLSAAQIAVDPGIGFGKTTDHNLRLLANAGKFHELGCPVLYGPSRKAFIGQVIGNPQADRAAGTIGAVLALAAQGVQVVRVHDVAAARQAALVFQACRPGKAATT